MHAKKKTHFLAAEKRGRRRKDGVPQATVARVVAVDGGRVSLRLEPAMWAALREIRGREGMTMHALMNDIRRSGLRRDLAAGARLYALIYFMQRATERGHRWSGHGRRPKSYAVFDNSAPWFSTLLPDGKR